MFRYLIHDGSHQPTSKSYRRYCGKTPLSNIPIKKSVSRFPVYGLRFFTFFIIRKSFLIGIKSVFEWWNEGDITPAPKMIFLSIWFHLYWLYTHFRIFTNQPRFNQHIANSFYFLIIKKKKSRYVIELKKNCHVKIQISPEIIM